MDVEELAEVAALWLADARAAWPDLVLDEATFVAQLTGRLPEQATREQALALHAADLWLAAACVAGNPAALAAFDACHLAPLDRVLAPSGLSTDEIDEVKQELRRKLLVFDGELPSIADYSGLADLRTWVRTSAIRAGIDLIRRRRDVPTDQEELAMMPALGDDPELSYMKERYQAEVRGAMVEAIARITPRERLLLKYQYVDGLSIDRIGALYGIHRATAARWLRSAREALSAVTLELLSQRFDMTSSQLRSLARLVESQLDLSIQQMLG